MAKEYIEREAALKLLEPYDGVGETWIEIDVVATGLHCIPAADVVEVKHGRWVLKERAHYFKCSLCNEPIPYKFGYSESRRYYNYCPNCGAKMDGGDNED